MTPKRRKNKKVTLESLIKIKENFNVAQLDFYKSFVGLKIVPNMFLKGDDYYILVSEELYDKVKRLT